MVLATLALSVTLASLQSSGCASRSNAPTSLSTPPLGAPRPNVLLVMADDAGLHMGAYGVPWVKTPAFDRVASSGLLFRRAYTPNAKCAPSRASVLTGRNPWQLEEGANHQGTFPAKFTTFVEALGAHGYTTGVTGKGWGPGDPGQRDGRPRQLTGPRFERHKGKRVTKGTSANDYTANLEDFLTQAPSGRPWMFWVGASEPHRGYDRGSGVRLGGNRPADIDRVPSFLPDEPTVREDLLDYAFEIETLDEQVGRMLALLEARGELGRTLVIVTSDNGMPFPRAKGQAYDSSNHLPLAIMWPGGVKAPGRIVDDLVSLIDLAPTLLELAGLDPAKAGMHPVTGRSLTGIFAAAHGGQIDPARDHVLVGKERNDIGRPHDVGYPIRGIVTRDALYLRNFASDRWPTGNPETGYLDCDGSPTKTLILEARRAGKDTRAWQLAFGRRPAEELYDLGADPDCVSNLAAVTDRAEQRRALATRLESRLRAEADPRILGHGEIFDTYPNATPALRDYHARYLAGQAAKAGWVSPGDYEPAPLD
jgi:arylsulfatase A-like enzyme